MKKYYKELAKRAIKKADKLGFDVLLTAIIYKGQRDYILRRWGTIK